MLSSMPKIMITLIIFSSVLSQLADGQFEDWCIADVQTPDDVLQEAMDWACKNGADCSKIQLNQPCFLPNTTADHASFAFNSYYQHMKSRGGDCYFNAAAIITSLDPMTDEAFAGTIATHDNILIYIDRAHALKFERVGHLLHCYPYIRRSLTFRKSWSHKHTYVKDISELHEILNEGDPCQVMTRASSMLQLNKRSILQRKP